MIPSNFSDFEGNKFNLRKVLISKLADKKFTVLDEKSAENLTNIDRCSYATADVLNTSSMFKNKITLVFKDCYGKEIFKNQGISNEKSFDVGYPEALIAALNAVQISAPKFMDTKVAATQTNTENPVIQKQNTDTEKKVEISNSISTADRFKLNGEVFQKVKLANGNFELKTLSGNQVAVFAPSTKSGVYRVILPNGSMTLGYAENNNLVIEMPNLDGSFRKEIFIANQN